MNQYLKYISPALLLILSTAEAAQFVQGGRDPFRPLYVSSNEPPLNLLALSRDHKLFYEAYNDASDLDGDGTYDVGYRGYILKPGESTAAPGKFKIDYYGYFDSYKCYRYNNNRFEPVEKTNNKKCPNNSGAPWSGDYLNYLTTSRMDAIRRVLYGGRRSTDTATDTILERAFIPQDAHAWGKEYKDVATDGYNIQDYTPLNLPSPSGRRHLFANTTLCSPGGCANSFNNPPLLRQVLNTDQRVWNWLSIERPVAGTQYATTNNTRSNFATITDYNVRVQACVANLLENECKKYGNTYKPIGLLQQYGDSDAMRFGLLTGSYSNNLQGGVLRKNIGKIDDEIDINNGTFKTTNGIIRTIDKLRIQGFQDSYEYFTGSVDTPCSYGNAFAKQLANGSCSGWGNPVGEMMLEAVRYLSGASSPTSAFKNDVKGATLGLPEVTAWADPYGIDSGTGKARNSVCAKPAITLISDINPNWDGDYISSTSINGKTFSPVSLLDAQWSAEFGGAKTVVIGSNGVTNDGSPTPKIASTFSNLRGLPDEPSKLGSYMTAAVAEFARTNDINPAGSSGTDGEKQLVNTMAIALASPLPSIKIPVNGKTVSIIPFAKSPSNGGSTGTSTDYRPVNQIVDYYIDNIYNVTGFPFNSGINGGRPQYVFRINFEDVEYGGDHDMDAIAQYTITLQADNTIKVVVDSIYAAGGINQHMGYVISGTTKDGVYLVVKDQGGADVKYWMDAKPAGTGNPSGDPISPQGNLTALSDTRTFSASSTSSTITDLKTPLWYAAKYGGFVDDEAEGNTNRDKLDNLSEWDSDGDGIPDNYFLVTNPLNLKAQLDRAFSRLDAVSRSSAPVGSSSGGGSETNAYRIYRTAYKIDQWSGNLSALPLSTTSLSLGVPYWEAASADKLQPWTGFGGSRILATWNPGPNSDSYARTGTAFEPGSGSFYMSAAQKAALQVKNYPATDTRTPDQVMIDRINYIRGDNTNEGTGTNKMRRREQSGTQSNYIADILDAQPYSVGPVPDPEYYTDAGYTAFANLYKNRLNFVYAGANGGVFHAFLDDVTPNINQTDNGKERFGYVPSFIFDKLRKLEDPAYNHEYYLNGRAAVQDVKTTDTGLTGSDWHTYLAASAGFGGKGIFVLDITKPNDVGSSEIPKVTRWEYFNSTDSTMGDPDMGYQPGSPLITKMNDGKWYVITGNGFNGDNGIAAIYFLLAAGPGNNGWDTNSVRKISIPATLAGTGFNGLSAPVAADLDDNGTADVLYAGDMLGNLWKFDVRDANPGNWTLGFGNKPLFKATRSDGAQPITMPPAVAWERRAESALNINNKRLMVYFGTGKFVEDCDKAGTTCTGQSDTASFYGIADIEEQFNGTTTENVTQASFDTITKSQLLEQRIASYGNGDVAAVSSLTGQTVTLSDIEGYRCLLPRNTDGSFGSKCTDSGTSDTPPIEYGWYADMPIAEERHVGMPRIAGGTVLFNTLIPENIANSVCGFTARSTVMVMNLDDGGQTKQRFVMSNSAGDKLSGIQNIGKVSTTSAPNGTTTVKGSNPSGLNDERGFGRNYNGKKKTQTPCEKAIDVDPLGNATEINVCDSRVVIPVNWTEVIQ